MTKIVLVAPAGIDSAHGIVDQARLLVARLVHMGHDAELIVVRTSRATQPAPPESACVRAREKSVPVDEVWSHLGHLDVLWIHYANFGLAEWRHVGAPLAFARRLRVWRRNHSTARLALSVHEGWEQPSPSDQPIRWLRGAIQRPALALAVRSADAVAVNCDRWLPRVERYAQSRVVKLPSPSNFPGPSTPRNAVARTDVVVMGGPTERSRLLEKLRHDGDWDRTLIDSSARIHSVGSAPHDEPAVQGLPVVNHGYLDAALIVELLAGCRLGVVDLPADVMDKSTVASTYRAHGIATLNLATRHVEAPWSVAPTTIPDLVDWLLDA